MRLHFRFGLKQSHSLRDANVNGILADFERESGWNTKTLRSLPDVKAVINREIYLNGIFSKMFDILSTNGPLDLFID